MLMRKILGYSEDDLIRYASWYKSLKNKVIILSVIAIGCIVYYTKTTNSSFGTLVRLMLILDVVDTFLLNFKLDEKKLSCHYVCKHCNLDNVKETVITMSNAKFQSYLKKISRRRNVKFLKPLDYIDLCLEACSYSYKFSNKMANLLLSGDILPSDNYNLLVSYVESDRNSKIKYITSIKLIEETK